MESFLGIGIHLGDETSNHFSDKLNHNNRQFYKPNTFSMNGSSWTSNKSRKLLIEIPCRRRRKKVRTLKLRVQARTPFCSRLKSPTLTTTSTLVIIVRPFSIKGCLAIDSPILLICLQTTFCWENAYLLNDVNKSLFGNSLRPDRVDHSKGLFFLSQNMKSSNHLLNV